MILKFPIIFAYNFNDASCILSLSHIKYRVISQSNKLPILPAIVEPQIFAFLVLCQGQDLFKRMIMMSQLYPKGSRLF